MTDSSATDFLETDSSMRWLLNAVYALLLVTLLPFLLWRVFRHGRYRRGLKEKFLGRLDVPVATRPLVWFHAVSVGEVIQLQKVVDAFREATGDRFRILITTSTDTGYDLAMKRFDGCFVSWYPLDFSWAVSNALKTVQPVMVVLMELEFWPNFLSTCYRRHIPVAVINARMGDKSFGRYQRFRFLVSPLFQGLSLAAAQSAIHSERLQALGVPKDCSKVTGSIKFDGVATARDNPKTNMLRRLFALADDANVLVAGSTQDPEELLAITAWESLRSEFPQLRLILVPRHKERFEAVAELTRARGHNVAQRSQLTDTQTAPAGSILLLDTIGELGACWGLADIAFVGGSFGKRGGQNMIEPAAYGACVLFGPNTWNFRDVVAAFRSSSACIQLEHEAQFTDTVRHLLRHPREREQLAASARHVVSSQQGATQSTAHLLAGLVDAESMRLASVRLKQIDTN